MKYATRIASMLHEGSATLARMNPNILIPAHALITILRLNPPVRFALRY